MRGEMSEPLKKREAAMFVLLGLTFVLSVFDSAETEQLSAKPVEAVKRENPISFERYQQARINRLEASVKCLRKRVGEDPKLAKVFPCVSSGERDANIIERYEWWERLNRE